LGFKSTGYRVKVFRLQGTGFRAQRVSGFEASRFRLQGLGFRVQGSGFGA